MCVYGRAACAAASSAPAHRGLDQLEEAAGLSVDRVDQHDACAVSTLRGDRRIPEGAGVASGAAEYLSRDDDMSAARRASEDRAQRRAAARSARSVPGVSTRTAMSPRGRRDVGAAARRHGCVRV